LPLGGLHVHVESAASFSVWLLLTHRRTLKRKFLDLENEIHHSLKVFRVEQSAIRRADSEARVHELIGADALRVALTWRCGRRGQGGGSIVNVASISGLLGLPVAHTYTAAKGAVINLTRSLCVTYAPDNIRSNCIAIRERTAAYWEMGCGC
jgi:NAD(P)-dependent dehydrogenase (short-subunit alcohol dehydrogenase family)